MQKNALSLRIKISLKQQMRLWTMDDGLETPVVAENESQQSDANTNYTSLIEQGQR